MNTQRNFKEGSLKIQGHKSLKHKEYKDLSIKLLRR